MFLVRKNNCGCVTVELPKAISVEDVARQNSIRLNLQEEFSRFGRVDRIKTILQNFYIIF